MKKKIRVKLSCCDHQQLEKTLKSIITSLRSTGALIRGPVVLPNDQKIITVLRSPHVNKDSREQFVRCTHKRLIDVYFPVMGSETMKVLKKFPLPAGVKFQFIG